ncbi:hypothetical protein EVJ58_g5446 [Rhodofomes roseus]|uniref:DNA 3'-5' helicase n=1 Tax=Rhodofomes roseus TaxID=34475 RepID=A0A4Y9YET1_9APHY|nr:hypothetical protein EVJ58_g5446 [Rhodofomes roseus]
MLPLLLPENREKTIIVISPLKSLENDQAKRFDDMGLQAVVVNGDTRSKKRVLADIAARKYRVVFMSPEMATENHECVETLRTMGLRRDILAFIIDEAHCISQWGGDFRPTYSKLHKVRTYVPPGTSISALSATLAPKPFAEVETGLLINPLRAFYLNRGNDRPNVKMSMKLINSSEDYATLDSELRLQDVRNPDNIPKTIIFAERRMDVQRIWDHLRKRVASSLERCIDFVHAGRTVPARDEALERFKSGQTRILVATECVAMGTDIPDVRRVIQFGIPNSLTTFLQRAGRGGRSDSIQAEAVLFAERSAFQVQRPRGAARNGHPGDQDSQTDTEDDDEQPTYKKKVEDALRLWMEATDCRRRVADKHFNNPPRPLNSTLEAPGAESIPGSPSKRPRMAPSSARRSNEPGLPLVRTGRHRSAAIAALQDWRSVLRNGRYASAPFSIFVVLPDELIRSVTYDARIQTLQQLQEKPAAASWAFLKSHGQELLDILRKVDEDYMASRRKGWRRRGVPDLENVPEVIGEDEDDRLIESWSYKDDTLRGRDVQDQVFDLDTMDNGRPALYTQGGIQSRVSTATLLHQERRRTHAPVHHASALQAWGTGLPSFRSRIEPTALAPPPSLTGWFSLSPSTRSMLFPFSTPSFPTGITSAESHASASMSRSSVSRP